MTRSSEQSLQTLVNSLREDWANAAARLGPLSDFEAGVLRAAAKRARASKPPTSTAEASRPDKQVIDGMGTIRAELVRQFLLDRTLAECLEPDGVLIQNARIVGELDRNSTHILFPLIFESCIFDAAITLLDCQCRSLTFSECQLTSIVGDRLTCTGGIWMTACTAGTEVRFLAQQLPEISLSVGAISMGYPLMESTSVEAFCSMTVSRAVEEYGFKTRISKEISAAALLSCRERLPMPRKIRLVKPS